MTNPTLLHHQAMELVDRSRLACVQGDYALADKYLHDAFLSERDAAFLTLNEVDLEPTRSVLCRSAASLALQCGEFRESERLIASGLAGRPPEEIAEELRDLLENVYFNRHLRLQGIVLDPSEIQLSLSGDSVGFGFAQMAEFVERATNLGRLAQRTAERKGGHPYRDRGRPAGGEQLEFYLSVPRAASFAATLRIGRGEQLSLPGMDLGQEVIDELFDCFDLLKSLALDALRERIGNDAYFRNFIALVRTIAPDGKNIRMVGLTALREGKARHVTLESGAGRVFPTELPAGRLVRGRPRELVGTLRLADSLSAREEIGVVDDRGNKTRVVIPEGLMDDIVKPMWRTRVRVLASRRGRKLVLDHIEKAGE